MLRTIIITRLKQPLLEPSSWHHALCTLLIGSLAYAYLYWQPSVQAPWLILASLLFSQAGLSAELRWRTAWQAIYYPLWGLLAALIVVILSLGTSWFLYTALLVFIAVFGLGYLGWWRRQYFFAAFTVSLLAIIAAFAPCQTALAWQRGQLVLFAAGLVGAIRFPFFLYQRSHGYFYAKAIFFQKLKKIYQLIFCPTEKPRDWLGPAWEESHFQIAWSDGLSALQVLKTKAPHAYSQNIERIWDLTLSLGSLRYRLTDFTVLNMGQDEMQSLFVAMRAILHELLRSVSNTACCDVLQQAIQKFEALYQAMLQTVAKEPLVLLLFIQDLYVLREEFEKLLLYTAHPEHPAPRQQHGGASPC